MPLREDVALQPLEPAEQLVHQPAHLGELTADRGGLGRDAFLDGLADLRRQGRLELSRRGSEVSSPCARAPAPRPRRPRRCAFGRLCETLPRALDRVLIHRRNTNLGVGCKPPSWTTSCRRS